MPRAGDIVLVPFPFTNLTGEKIRPALVLATVGHNVIIAAITTQWERRQHHSSDLEITTSDPKFAATGLKTRSLIRLSKITTVETPIILGRIGRLDAKRQKEITNKLRRLFRF